MKKLLITAASAAALSLPLLIGATTPALALNVSDYCKANNDFGMSHGECVGQLINGNIPKFCRAFLDADPVAFEAQFGSTSLGACVSTIRHEIKAA